MSTFSLSTTLFTIFSILVLILVIYLLFKVIDIYKEHKALKRRIKELENTVMKDNNIV